MLHYSRHVDRCCCSFQWSGIINSFTGANRRVDFYWGCIIPSVLGCICVLSDKINGPTETATIEAVVGGRNLSEKYAENQLIRVDRLMSAYSSVVFWVVSWQAGERIVFVFADFNKEKNKLMSDPEKMSNSGLMSVYK